MIWLGVVALIIAPALTRKCSVQIIATVFRKLYILNKTMEEGRQNQHRSDFPVGLDMKAHLINQSSHVYFQVWCQTQLFRQLLIDFSFASLDLGWL